jgi:hypothetical protein
MLVLCGVQKLFYSSSVALETWYTPLDGVAVAVGVVRIVINGETKKLVREGACWCGKAR